MSAYRWWCSHPPQNTIITLRRCICQRLHWRWIVVDIAQFQRLTEEGVLRDQNEENLKYEELESITYVNPQGLGRQESAFTRGNSAFMRQGGDILRDKEAGCAVDQQL